MILFSRDDKFNLLNTISITLKNTGCNSIINSRLIAAQVLCRILKEGQSLTAALDHSLQDVDSSKERAFIQALCYGVVRQFHRLNFILNQLLHKPLKDTDVQALALLGLYQLKYMRVKPHAAVSETVAALRKKPQAKSLLNAVLRNYLRKQETLEEQADNNNSALVSHPDWLINQIENNWPQQAQQILNENNRQAPMALRVNSSRCNRENYMEQLTEKAILASVAPVCPTAIVLNKPVAVEVVPGFADGLVSVQDTAAQLAAGLLEVKPGQRVLDVCAAPGGKTAHILEMQPKLADLLAVEIDKNRLQRVKENMERLDLSAQLIHGDATKPAEWWDGRPFDRILLDAPCTALGVIRRHPDIKLLRRKEDIQVLQSLQKELLNTVWKLLVPEGILLYATCSILKQENELQVRSFLQEHHDAVEVAIDAGWGMAREHGRQILPGDSGMDGFYYAKIRKI